MAVLNASYEPGHFHTRKSGGKVQEIHLFGTEILDGLDTLLQPTRPDMRGLISRCIIIRVRMADDGYRRPRWDKDAQDLARRGRDRLAMWAAQQVADGLADVIPELPEGLGTPRRCALYEPLFAIALAADKGDPDGYWSTAMADAAWELEASLSLRRGAGRGQPSSTASWPAGTTTRRGLTGARGARASGSGHQGERFS